MASTGDLWTIDDSSYNLDFRSTKDDAWYTARVILDGQTLTVKFKDFYQTFHDEVFRVGDFVTSGDVDEFLQRFRPVCLTFDDNECEGVIEGMTVCATYKGDGTVRFFDAVVEDVNYNKHLSDKCMCTFLLFWQHGPVEGYVTSTSISDICRIEYGPVDSRVAYFANLANGKIRRYSSQDSLVYGNMSSCKGLTIKTESSSPLDKLQEMESGKQFPCSVPSTEGWEGKKKLSTGDQDGDMGGTKETGCHHYIIIENLEKDLSPLLIMEFVHEQTSITTQAYVFPSLSSESYARGAIVLDSRPKLKRVYEFITNPNHFIVSLTGRPWVIAENILRVGNFKTDIGSLLPRSQCKFQNKNIDSGLKVICSGTEEYKRAKRLKGLFMEFHNHLNGLRKTLDVQEKRLLHPSHAF